MSFGSTSKKNLTAIVILQKKAIRILFKLKIDETFREHLTSLNLFTLLYQYILYCIVYVKDGEGKIQFRLIWHTFAFYQGRIQI